MSLLSVGERFIWRTLWTKARLAACAKNSNERRALLERVAGFGGAGPAAVEAVLAREAGDVWPRHDLLLFRAWRADTLAGGRLAWGLFKRSWPRRAAAMQAIAVAARHGRHGHDAIQFAAGFLSKTTRRAT